MQLLHDSLDREVIEVLGEHQMGQQALIRPALAQSAIRGQRSLAQFRAVFPRKDRIQLALDIQLSRFAGQLLSLHIPDEFGIGGKVVWESMRTVSTGSPASFQNCFPM